MQFKKSIRTVLLIFLGILTLVLFLLINLSFIFESQIQKKLPDFLKTGDLDFSVQKIGVSNAFISKIRITQGLFIDSISLDYTIGPFKGLVIDKVTVSGLSLKAGPDKNNQLHMEGLSFPSASISGAETHESAFPAFLPEKIIMKNSRIILKVLDEEFLIPFEVNSDFRRKEKKIMIQAKIHPFGETISSTLTYDFKSGMEFVRVEGKSFDLDHLAPYIRKNIKEMNLKGAIDFKLESFSPEKEWKFYISRLGLVKPVDMALEEIKAGIVINKSIVSAAGTFRLAHPLLSENEMTYDLKIDTTKGLSSEFSINTGPLTVRAHTVDASFPEAVVFGNVSMDENNIPKGRILITSSNGKIQSTPYKTLVSDLSFEIPIHFPDVKEDQAGKFSASSVIYDDHYAFSTTGTILQTSTGKFRVNGWVLSKFLPPVKTKIMAELDLEKDLKAFINFETNQFKLNFADIRNLIPEKQKPFELDLSAFVKGSMDYADRRLKSRMQVNMNDTRIRLPESDLTLKGINARIDLNDLLIPETVPGQTLTIQSIDVKKIRISEAKIQFSLEDAKSLLIENIRFKWCNGLISTESIRFPQEKNEYHLTLFCDRLELTGLLEQMGAFHTEGDGTLNGRIPLVYKDGEISFNNGFLFSTPGSRGKVVIENTDRIIAGIPMDSPEFSQLDVAREALKDFDYEWAKLTFNTQGDILSVSMELDGKPAGLLPFEYKKELGGFIRVDASSPGSRFQGIKLDVNLKLPFNDVMKFGNQLQSMLNKKESP